MINTNNTLNIPKIIFKTICLILIVALLVNEVSFAADEIRSCLAVPNFFNPPCRVVFDKAGQKYKLNVNTAAEDVPGHIFLWYVIAGGLHKRVPLEELQNFIETIVVAEYGRASLHPFNWENIRYENGNIILPTQNTTQEYCFSRERDTQAAILGLEVEPGEFVWISTRGETVSALSKEQEEPIPAQLLPDEESAREPTRPKTIREEKIDRIKRAEEAFHKRPKTFSGQPLKPQDEGRVSIIDNRFFDTEDPLNMDDPEIQERKLLGVLYGEDRNIYEAHYDRFQYEAHQSDGTVQHDDIIVSQTAIVKNPLDKDIVGTRKANWCLPVVLADISGGKVNMIGASHVYAGQYYKLPYIAESLRFSGYSNLTAVVPVHEIIKDFEAWYSKPSNKEVLSDLAENMKEYFKDLFELEEALRRYSLRYRLAIGELRSRGIRVHEEVIESDLRNNSYIGSVATSEGFSIYRHYRGGDIRESILTGTWDDLSEEAEAPPETQRKGKLTFLEIFVGAVLGALVGYCAANSTGVIGAIAITVYAWLMHEWFGHSVMAQTILRNYNFDEPEISKLVMRNRYFTRVWIDWDSPELGAALRDKINRIGRHLRASIDAKVLRGGPEASFCLFLLTCAFGLLIFSGVIPNVNVPIFNLPLGLILTIAGINHCIHMCSDNFVFITHYIPFLGPSHVSEDIETTKRMTDAEMDFHMRPKEFGEEPLAFEDTDRIVVVDNKNLKKDSPIDFGNPRAQERTNVGVTYTEARNIYEAGYGYAHYISEDIDIRITQTAVVNEPTDEDVVGTRDASLCLPVVFADISDGNVNMIGSSHIYADDYDKLVYLAHDLFLSGYENLILVIPVPEMLIDFDAWLTKHLKSMKDLPENEVSMRRRSYDYRVVFARLLSMNVRVYEQPIQMELPVKLRTATTATIDGFTISRHYGKKYAFWRRLFGLNIISPVSMMTWKELLSRLPSDYPPVREGHLTSRDISWGALIGCMAGYIISGLTGVALALAATAVTWFVHERFGHAAKARALLQSLGFDEDEIFKLVKYNKYYTKVWIDWNQIGLGIVLRRKVDRIWKGLRDDIDAKVVRAGPIASLVLFAVTFIAAILTYFGFIPNISIFDISLFLILATTSLNALVHMFADRYSLFIPYRSPDFSKEEMHERIMQAGEDFHYIPVQYGLEQLRESDRERVWIVDNRKIASAKGVNLRNPQIQEKNLRRIRYTQGRSMFEAVYKDLPKDPRSKAATQTVVVTDPTERDVVGTRQGDWCLPVIFADISDGKINMIGSSHIYPPQYDILPRIAKSLKLSGYENLVVIISPLARTADFDAWRDRNPDTKLRFSDDFLRQESHLYRYSVNQLRRMGVRVYEKPRGEEDYLRFYASAVATMEGFIIFEGDHPTPKTIICVMTWEDLLEELMSVQQQVPPTPPQLAPKYKIGGLILGTLVNLSTFSLSMGGVGFVAALGISISAFLLGWGIHELGHLLAGDFKKPEVSKRRSGPLASFLLFAVTAFLYLHADPNIMLLQFLMKWNLPLIGSQLSMITHILGNIPITAVLLAAMANYFIHIFADEMALFTPSDPVSPSKPKVRGRGERGTVITLSRSVSLPASKATKKGEGSRTRSSRDDAEGKRRKTEHMPIILNGPQYTEEGIDVASIAASEVNDETRLNDFCERIAAEEGMPEAAVVRQHMATVYRFYRSHAAVYSGASTTEIIDAYNINLRKNLERPAQFNPVNNTIILSIDLLRIAPQDLLPFLTFVTGHEGEHVEAEEEQVIWMDIDRFSSWSERHQSSVVRAIQDLPYVDESSMEYVYTLMTESAEHYRHEAGSAVDRQEKRRFYRQSLSLCKQVVEMDRVVPIRFVIIAANCRGYAANEMARLALLDLEHMIRVNAPDSKNEHVQLLYREVQDWLLTLAFPNFTIVIRNSDPLVEWRSKGLPRACAGYSFGMNILTRVDLALYHVSTESEKKDLLDRMLTHTSSGLSYAERGLSVDSHNDHAIAAAGENLRMMQSTLTLVGPVGSVREARGRNISFTRIRKRLAGLEKLEDIDYVVHRMENLRVLSRLEYLRRRLRALQQSSRSQNVEERLANLEELHCGEDVERRIETLGSEPEDENTARCMRDLREVKGDEEPISAVMVGCVNVVEHHLEFTGRVMEGCDALPEIFIKAVRDTVDIEFDTFFDLYVEDEYPDPAVHGLLLDVTEAWRSGEGKKRRYDILDAVIVRVLVGPKPKGEPEVDIKVLVQKVKERVELTSLFRDVRAELRNVTTSGITREQLGDRILEGRYAWLGLEPGLIDDTQRQDTPVSLHIPPLRRVNRELDRFKGSLATVEGLFKRLAPWLDERDADRINARIAGARTCIAKVEVRAVDLSDRKKATTHKDQEAFALLYYGGRQETQAEFKRRITWLEKRVDLRLKEGPLAAIGDLQKRLEGCRDQAEDMEGQIQTAETTAVHQQALDLLDTAQALSRRPRNLKSETETNFISLDLYNQVMEELDILENEIEMIRERLAVWRQLTQKLASVEEELRAPEMYEQAVELLLVTVEILRNRLRDQFADGPQQEIGGSGTEEAITELESRTELLKEMTQVALAIQQKVDEIEAELEGMKPVLAVGGELRMYFEKKLAISLLKQEIITQLGSSKDSSQMEDAVARVEALIEALKESLIPLKERRWHRILELGWPAFVFTAACLFRERMILAGMDEQHYVQGIWELLDEAESMLHAVVTADLSSGENKAWEEFQERLINVISEIAAKKGSNISIRLEKRDRHIQVLATDLFHDQWWTIADEERLVATEDDRRRSLKALDRLGRFHMFTMDDLSRIYRYTILGPILVTGSALFHITDQSDIYGVTKHAFKKAMRKVLQDGERQMDEVFGVLSPTILPTDDETLERIWAVTIECMELLIRRYPLEHYRAGRFASDGEGSEGNLKFWQILLGAVAGGIGAYFIAGVVGLAGAVVAVLVTWFTHERFGHEAKARSLLRSLNFTDEEMSKLIKRNKYYTEVKIDWDEPQLDEALREKVDSISKEQRDAVDAKMIRAGPKVSLIIALASFGIFITLFFIPPQLQFLNSIFLAISLNAIVHALFADRLHREDEDLVSIVVDEGYDSEIEERWPSGTEETSHDDTDIEFFKVAAFKGTKEVGAIYGWHMRDQTEPDQMLCVVSNVYVKPFYRRRGVGEKLFRKLRHVLLSSAFRREGINKALFGPVSVPLSDKRAVAYWKQILEEYNIGEDLNRQVVVTREEFMRELGQVAAPEAEFRGQTLPLLSASTPAQPGAHTLGIYSSDEVDYVVKAIKSRSVWEHYRRLKLRLEALGLEGFVAPYECAENYPIRTASFSDVIPLAVIQKKVPLLGDVLDEARAQRDVAQVKEILDKYIDSQVAFLQNGIVDLCANASYKNYGVDNAGHVVMLDIVELVPNRELTPRFVGVIKGRIEAYLTRVLEGLGNTGLPEHFEARLADEFTVDYDLHARPVPAPEEYQDITDFIRNLGEGKRLFYKFRESDDFPVVYNAADRDKWTQKRKWFLERRKRFLQSLPQTPYFDNKNYLCFRHTVGEILANAYDAIASNYDPRISAEGPREFYEGLVGIQFQILRGNLVVTVIDNGKGNLAATTTQKEQYFGTDLYLGGGGVGLERVKRFVGYVDGASFELRRGDGQDIETRAILRVPLTSLSFGEIVVPVVPLPEMQTQEDEDEPKQLSVKETLGEDFKEQLEKMKALHSAYKSAEGESDPKALILYVDDIWKNAILYDFEDTLKELTEEGGILSRGKIVLYTKDKALEEVVSKLKMGIKQIASDMDVIIVHPEDICASAHRIADPVDEIDGLIETLKSGHKAVINRQIEGDAKKINPDDIVGIIRGNGLDWLRLFPDYNNYQRAKGYKIPLVILNGRQNNLRGIFSFAQAISLAVAMINSKGYRTWVRYLNCIEGTERLYEQYLRERNEILTKL